MRPLVSIVMPIKNGARWLDEAIDSAIRQTFTNFELLTIDDGSADDTPEILHDWSRRDSRVRPFHLQGFGLVTALNRGLYEARAPLIARLDADDRAAPHRLECQVQVMEENPDIGLLGSWAQRIDERGKFQKDLKPETRSRVLSDLLVRINPFVHSTVMFRKEIVQTLGGYRGAFEAAEDYDLWLRISEVAQIANLADQLIQYRRHRANVTARLAIRQAFSVRLAQRSAAARRRIGRDPAINLASPPDWWLPESLQSFFADDVVTYRLLNLADENFVSETAESDFSPLVAKLPELNYAERQLAARAIANHMRHASLHEVYRTCGVFARMVKQRPGMAFLAARHVFKGVAVGL